jgi:hypothetical protein
MNAGGKEMKRLGIEDYNLIKDEIFKARKCMSQ